VSFVLSSALAEILARASREVRLLGAATPANAPEERVRLVAAFERGEPALPRWKYARVDHGELRRSLDGCARAFAEGGARGPEAAVLGAHDARTRELSLEAEMAEAAGTPRLGELARTRFAPPDAATEACGARLADAWLAAPTAAETAEGPRIRSDADDDRSLLSRMRHEVGRRCLPFAVVAHAALAPLAATGERTILVARGRGLTDEDARRTVLHEIEGHALPRVRARAAKLAIFAFGTARGADDQEGRAVLLEERARFLGARRKHQLAARHRTVLRMLGGATFVDATRALIDGEGLPPRDAVLVAERVFRGGDGKTCGLGRERIYLESFVRVRRALEARPEDEAVMMAGQVAVEAIDALRAHV
jgi:hypothetical protein